MPLTIALTAPTETSLDSVGSEDFYQAIRSSSNTIISIQYKSNEFLSFKVYEARSGVIVNQGVNDIALQCKIRGTSYTFNRRHLDQMSKREINELFNHLRLDGSKFC